jgi:hypothetical protein
MDQFRPTDEQFAKIAPHLPTDTRGKARAGRAVIAAREGGTDAAEAVGRAVGWESMQNRGGWFRSGSIPGSRGSRGRWRNWYGG